MHFMNVFDTPFAEKIDKNDKGEKEVMENLEDKGKMNKVSRFGLWFHSSFSFAAFLILDPAFWCFSFAGITFTRMTTLQG